jgi:hypothetical protein
VFIYCFTLHMHAYNICANVSTVELAHFYYATLFFLISMLHYEMCFFHLVYS